MQGRDSSRTRWRVPRTTRIRLGQYNAFGRRPHPFVTGKPLATQKKSCNQFLTR